jgi:hypothetical protein
VVTISVRGRWSSLDRIKYTALGADGVEANYAKGFDEASGLGFIADLNNLRHLSVISTKAMDLRSIADCATLESLDLTIRGRNVQAIQLGRLDRLGVLSLSPASLVSDLSTLQGLTKLRLDGWRGDSLEGLSGLVNLSELALYSAGALTSLAGVQSMTSLVSLEVYGAVRLEAIAELASDPRLVKLEFAKTKRVTDWERLGTLRTLRWLGLEDVGVIPSLSFIRQLDSLESLFVTGRSRVGDGRIAFLADLPKLRRVSIAHLPGLDVSPDELRRRIRRGPHKT